MNPQDNPINGEERSEESYASSIKLDDVLSLYHDSKRFSETAIIPRAVKNMKLLKGIPLEDKSTRSKITGRNKIYFRKIWSSAWRLVSIFTDVFLSDENKAKISGRDENSDWMKAKVLEFMLKYRFDRLLRHNSAFVKFVWAFLDAICPGITVIKWQWKYNEETGEDGPDFTTYPLEQVCLDWGKDVQTEMRYAFFENFLTADDLEETDYDNTSKFVPIGYPTSQLRSARYNNAKDPLNPNMAEGQNYNSGTVGQNFPSASSGDATQSDPIRPLYRVVEGFYKKKGEIYFCVFNPEGKVWAKKPELSVYGDLMPIAVGSMLLEAHKLVPESIAEILEGPQESLNLGLNLRKDNQILGMQGGWIIGRYGNVDTQALGSAKPGWQAKADDINQVRAERAPDVTQSSYQETAFDINMIEEMSGINDTTLGQSHTGKTGEAQINLQQSIAKSNLFTAIVGETLFKQSIYILARMIQKFETDETVFRVANEELRRSVPVGSAKAAEIPNDDIFDVEFDMDLVLDVGASEVSRQIEFQKFQTAAQMLLQANDSTMRLMAAGVQIPDPKIYDVASLAAEHLSDLGIKGANRFLVKVTPPPPEAQGGGAQNGAGASQPNENPADFLAALRGTIGAGQ